ncbi:hypothetical protein OHA37_03585 [Streptomyces sp. NBC_00335]|uniref:hypothetical protein n=1 Tax=unclassified Streptomyces TaxID=2593676 RepID=UPI00224FA2D0|nr:MULTISPECIES: hypothetical protein [unclassified Streptomyces]MCX5402967.1 hypothetical protein [Streptomyces sp. NBC_00086]
MNVSAGGRPADASRRTASRRKVRTATLLCAVAAMTAAVLPASANTGAAAPARTPVSQDPVVVVDCFEQAQMRPQEYLLACGDGNNRLVRLRWDTWGQSGATATGTDMVNDCRPYCAAGRFHAYPVKVTLSDPQAWPEHPDLRRFTTIRLLYTDTAPDPVPKDVTYKLVY